MFVFGVRSRQNLIGVKPDLVTLCRHTLAASPIDFTIIDGVRTPEEQRILLAKGKSWTLNSRHLTGHAIDFAAFVNGEITFDVQHYPKIVDAFKLSARILNIPIVCGADWKRRDYGHIELDRAVYP